MELKNFNKAACGFLLLLVTVANIPLNLLATVEGYGRMIYDYDNGINYYRDSDVAKEAALQAILDTTLRHLDIPSEIVVHENWDDYDPNLMYTCAITSITSITCSVRVDDNFFYLYPWYLQSVSIPKTVLFIKEGIFRPFYGFESWPDSNIYDGSISAFTEIHVDSDNPNYSDVDGILYNKDKSVLIACPPAKTECNIPSTVTKINNYAFSGCRSLKSLTIPNSVKEIGLSVFEGCANVETITIPESVTSIGDYAFKNCESLVSIDFPATLTTVGDDIFKGCSKLKEIHVAPGNDRFADETGVLYNKDLSELLFYPQAAATEYSVPNTVRSINANAFKGCSHLSAVDLPPSVISIGESAFSGCSSLTTINIPSMVTSIEKETFADCISLPSIIIPSSVISIGERAFIGCSSLKHVALPSSVEIMGSEAFRDCTSLSEFTIPDGIEKIEAYTFANCSSLSEITIPASVKYIGFCAFDDCISLLTIKSMSMVPPATYGNSFAGVPLMADVYVPKRTVPYYLQSAEWSHFYYYIEVDEWVNGISDVTADGSATSQDVYTLQGICIKHDATPADIESLPEGLYIIGGKKVYVK